jgi:hypothetical protein
MKTIIMIILSLILLGCKPDGSETKVTAGNDVVITGTGTIENPYVVSSKAHYIGESYGGGIVFYVYDNGQHGLIADTTDQSKRPRCTGIRPSTNNPVRDGIGAGKFNTERMIANLREESVDLTAAQICANYQGGNYGDWYLPSKYELNLLYMQKDVVGGFVHPYYWSSNEGGACACRQSFEDGGYQECEGVKRGDQAAVRAIRAF